MLKPNTSKQDLLEVIEDLRQKAESGEIIAFTAVGIKPDDNCLQWSASRGGVTKLRLLGAVTWLQLVFLDD